MAGRDVKEIYMVATRGRKVSYLISRVMVTIFLLALCIPNRVILNM